MNYNQLQEWYWLNIAHIPHCDEHVRRYILIFNIQNSDSTQWIEMCICIVNIVNPVWMWSLRDRDDMKPQFSFDDSV